jgi:rod shape-determining protein MreC
MIREPSSRPWLPLLLVILGLLFLVLNEAGLLTPVESALHYVLDPLQRVFAGGMEVTGGLFGSVREARELRSQVAELQARADALTVENVRLREYEAEVQQLRSMLNFVSEYPIEAPLGADVVSRDACETYPCAEVVGTDPNPYLRYITINVGAQQGVEVGMPVVSSGAALVGRVSQVGPRTAKVQLLTDADSAVASLIQRTRVTGLVTGQPDGSLKMDYVAQSEELDVGVGDIVLTSGLGGVMPKGLVIGQVSDVERAPYEMFQPILVRPAVDFSRLELVLVITRFEQIPIDEVSPQE